MCYTPHGQQRLVSTNKVLFQKWHIHSEYKLSAEASIMNLLLSDKKKSPELILIELR